VRALACQRELRPPGFVVCRRSWSGSWWGVELASLVKHQDQLGIEEGQKGRGVFCVCPPTGISCFRMGPCFGSYKQQDGRSKAATDRRTRANTSREIRQHADWGDNTRKRGRGDHREHESVHDGMGLGGRTRRHGRERRRRTRRSSHCSVQSAAVGTNRAGRSAEQSACACSFLPSPMGLATVDHNRRFGAAATPRARF
jgi:hypothetical protein